MTVVYVDSVFVLNALMDYLLVLCAARLAGIPLRRRRYLLAGLLGGAYAVAVFLPGLGFLSATPVKLAAGILLALAAYGGEAKLLRLTLLLFAVSCAMAGCVLALGLVAGGGVPMVNGVFYTDVDAKVLLTAAAAAYLVLTVVFRAAAGKGVRGELVRAQVCLAGRTTAFTAFCDTGNALRDPVSGAPVLVVSPGRLDGALPREVRSLLDRGALERPAELLEPMMRAAPELRFRLIPYHAVGVAGGLLLAVRSDWTEVAGERYAGLPVAFSPTELGTGYSALWGGTAGRRETMKDWMKQWRRLLVRVGLLPPAELHYIGGSDTLPPPLSREREAELLERIGEEDARKELIEHNLRLVVYIARRFENTGVGIEDLISIGTIGLIKAVGTYRTDKNIKLATYASRCIENEILMYLRKNAGRKGEVSFDEPLNTDWDGNELLLSDVLGTEADVVMRPIEEDVERDLLAAAINVLSPREKQIITLRFGLGGGKEQTQKEVADQLGISQSYISRLEKRIISRLKKEILRLS